jgi:hypothetical protein
VRFSGQNVKSGQSLLVDSVSEAVSADIVLQDIRWELLALSTLEEHEIDQSNVNPDGNI